VSAHDLERRRRLLLDEDVERYIRAAEDSDIGRGPDSLMRLTTCAGACEMGRAP
jgi:hypothetical protein